MVVSATGANTLIGEELSWLVFCRLGHSLVVLHLVLMHLSRLELTLG